MNDPHVVSLSYDVEHGTNVDYKNAEPLIAETPDFKIEVDKGVAKFELKSHFATIGDAQAVVGPFVRGWELSATLSEGPNQFRLKYRDALVIDRKPGPGTTMYAATGRFSITGATAISTSVDLSTPPRPRKR